MVTGSPFHVIEWNISAISATERPSPRSLPVSADSVNSAMRNFIYVGGKSGGMSENTRPGQIGAVTRALDILEAIQDLEGARVTELADHLDLAPSTVHSHLKTLHANRYLNQEGDQYHIGLEFLNKGGFARRRKDAYTMAFDLVEDLAAETEERAQFLVEEHGRGIYLHTATGCNAVQVNARLGRVNYLHASSAGKAIFAHLPEQRIGDIIDRWGLRRFTDNTITERSALLDELESVRERGYAFNHEESVSGLRAVGVPVLGPNDQVVGAFSVSGPTNRLKGTLLEEDVPNLLLGAANELELNIEFE